MTLSFLQVLLLVLNAVLIYGEGDVITPVVRVPQVVPHRRPIVAPAVAIKTENVNVQNSPYPLDGLAIVGGSRSSLRSKGIVGVVHHREGVGHVNDDHIRRPPLPPQDRTVSWIPRPRPHVVWFGKSPYGDYVDYFKNRHTVIHPSLISEEPKVIPAPVYTPRKSHIPELVPARRLPVQPVVDAIVEDPLPPRRVPVPQWLPPAARRGIVTGPYKSIVEERPPPPLVAVEFGPNIRLHEGPRRLPVHEPRRPINDIHLSPRRLPVTKTIEPVIEELPPQPIPIPRPVVRRLPDYGGWRHDFDSQRIIVEPVKSFVEEVPNFDRPISGPRPFRKIIPDHGQWQYNKYINDVPRQYPIPGPVNLPRPLPEDIRPPPPRYWRQRIPIQNAPRQRPLPVIEPVKSIVEDLPPEPIPLPGPPPRRIPYPRPTPVDIPQPRAYPHPDRVRPRIYEVEEPLRISDPKRPIVDLRPVPVVVSRPDPGQWRPRIHVQDAPRPRPLPVVEPIKSVVEDLPRAPVPLPRAPPKRIPHPRPIPADIPVRAYPHPGRARPTIYEVQEPIRPADPKRPLVDLRPIPVDGPRPIPNPGQWRPRPRYYEDRNLRPIIEEPIPVARPLPRKVPVAPIRPAIEGGPHIKSRVIPLKNVGEEDVHIAPAPRIVSRNFYNSGVFVDYFAQQYGTQPVFNPDRPVRPPLKTHLDSPRPRPRVVPDIPVAVVKPIPRREPLPPAKVIPILPHSPNRGHVKSVSKQIEVIPETRPVRPVINGGPAVIPVVARRPPPPPVKIPPPIVTPVKPVVVETPVKVVVPENPPPVPVSVPVATKEKVHHSQLSSLLSVPQPLPHVKTVVQRPLPANYGQYVDYYTRALGVDPHYTSPIGSHVLEEVQHVQSVAEPLHMGVTGFRFYRQAPYRGEVLSS